MGLGERTRDHGRWPSGRLADFGLLAFVLAVYVATLMPGVAATGDSTKFQFIGHVLGTPHATGYPTYMLLGWAFSHLFPFGSLAFKANLLSALFATAAVGVFLRVAYRLGVRRMVAWAAALAFAFSFTFWSQATLAEVYTLNALFVALTLWGFIRWHQTRRDADLYMASGLYALSFGNHLTMIWLLPAVVVLCLLTDRRLFVDARRIAVIAGLVMLGALQYAYIFWRSLDPGARFVEMRATDWQSFWWYVSGAQFKHLMFPFSLEQLVSHRIPWALGFVGGELYWLPPVLALGGLALVARPLAVFGALAIAGPLVFAINYHIPDIAAYFIPVVLVICLLMAVALEAAAVVTARWRWSALLLIPPLLMAAHHYPRQDRSEQGRATEQHYRAVVERVGGDAVPVPAAGAVRMVLCYLVLGELDDSRGLHIASHATPEGVAAYVRDGRPLTLPLQRRQAPPGLPVYVVGEQVPEGMRGPASRFVPVARGLWKLEAR